MKKIKTNNYIQKEAQGYPPGVTGREDYFKEGDHRKGTVSVEIERMDTGLLKVIVEYDVDIDRFKYDSSFDWNIEKIINKDGTIEYDEDEILLTAEEESEIENYLRDYISDRYIVTGLE